MAVRETKETEKETMTSKILPMTGISGELFKELENATKATFPSITLRCQVALESKT